MGHYEEQYESDNDYLKRLSRQQRKTKFLETEVDALFDTVDELRKNISWLHPDALSLSKEQHRFLGNIQNLIGKLP